MPAVTILTAESGPTPQVTCAKTSHIQTNPNQPMGATALYVEHVTCVTQGVHVLPDTSAGALQ